LPSEWPSNSIVVLHGLLPEKLPPGDLFIIDPATACDEWELGGVLENPIVTEQDKTSPLMTHIRLDNVLVPQAKEIRFKTKPKVLAGTVTGEPIFAEIKRSNGKCLVLSVNLEQSDLAFRTAFPIMATNSLGWFAGQSGELRESAMTGRVTSIDLEDQLVDKKLLWRSPRGTKTAMRIAASLTDREKQPMEAENGPTEKNENDSATKIGPFDECGIWRVVTENAASTSNVDNSDDSKSIAEMAVNLANLRETDLRPLNALRKAAEGQINVTGWLSRPIWFYLVAAACVLTTAEWFMYQRRVIT
jgi:hypothetical protein